MPKSKTTGKLFMKCVFPFCDGAALVTICKGNRVRGAMYQDYSWTCDCRAKGFFTAEHFKRIDKAGGFALK